MPATPFIVPFGRDGAADRAARAWASSRFTIENHPGEGGLLGVERANGLARANQPVLLLGTPSTHVLLPGRLGAAARPDDAFLPIQALPSAPNVLLASPRLGVRTVGELVERARRETLVYASAGAGQTIHVCTALFCEQAGVRMSHRPYAGGSATAYEDIAAGRVHVYFDNVLACHERVARGDVVALAVSARVRDRRLPDVPTLPECGFPGHALDVWLGVFGAHLPRSDIDAPSAEALGRRVEASRVDWRRALAIAGG